MTIATPIDPSVDGFSMRIDAANGTPLISRLVPGGAVGWRRTGKRWTFRDSTGTIAGGLRKVVIIDLSARAPGLYRVKVSGREADFQVGAGENSVTA